MQESIKKKILEAIDLNQNYIVEFLQKLVKINSVTGSESEIQEFLSDYFAEMGITVDKFVPQKALLQKQNGYVPIEVDFTNRPNVVAIQDGTGGGRSLILNGHVDTITLEPIDRWTVNPLSGLVCDGKLYGRGAADMKSGLAAMIMAVKFLRETGVCLKGSVIIECVVDEEYTGYGTLACIAKGYKADAGICCETSGLSIQPACIGRLWFYIDVFGKTASVANKWEAVSAIEKAMKIVHAIDDLEDIRLAELTHPLYADNRTALPCAVCVFNSGTFPSAIPEKAHLEGSMGVMPYETVESVRSQITEHIKRVAETDAWMKHHPPVVSFRTTGGYGAEIPLAHPIVQTLGKAFSEVAGDEPVYSGRSGGSDTRYLIRFGNTPTVIFGPGDTKQMHATDEHVVIENYITAVKTLAIAIFEWCS